MKNKEKQNLGFFKNDLNFIEKTTLEIERIRR